jgi:hypothetical protein
MLSVRRKQPPPPPAPLPGLMLMATRPVGASYWHLSLDLNIKPTRTPFAKK